MSSIGVIIAAIIAITVITTRRVSTCRACMSRIATAITTVIIAAGDRLARLTGNRLASAGLFLCVKLTGRMASA
ncbi:MAG: hypothetical protein WBA48_14365 [Xanthobacteraceae bacterium]